jgi:nucleoid DNA-binding protein
VVEMLSKEELVKNVAQSCGVSPEISAFFFEVFVNRLSNHLKPGDLLHFYSFGYFHKRNCRIQLEKSPDSPTAKSYLIQLILFSEEQKIKNDLGVVQFLKIPNLKTLWLDDPDFQNSLNAGDFAPYIDRNQLIKSFATTAEVIIAGLRKDYDSDLVEELIIPLTFDLNFLIKTGQKTIPITTSAINKSSAETSKTSRKGEEPSEEGLPWNYGTKFLDKDKVTPSDGLNVNAKQSDIREKTIAVKQEADFRKDQVSRLKDFEPVTSHLSAKQDELNSLDDVDTVKFNVSKAKDKLSENLKVNKKFTEVKSKTEAYRHKGEFGKNKKGIIDKYSSGKELSGTHERTYRERRNLIPYISLFTFIAIAGAVIYIYLIKDDLFGNGYSNIAYSIKPASNVNVIERDYEFAVTYPYPKTENRILVSGYSSDIFSGVKNILDVEVETTPEVKPESKPEEIAKVNDKPKEIKKNELPIEEERTITPEIKEEKISRIFLYKNFYVVHAGTFKTEEAANREADRYFYMGYNAFIEVVESRSGALVYNLNVGDFTSEEFAQQFQEKYIK